MYDEPPQDTHRPAPLRADQAAGHATAVRPLRSVRPSRTQSDGGGRGSRSATQDADHDPERASGETLTHESACARAVQAAAKESVQSIPLSRAGRLGTPRST